MSPRRRLSRDRLRELLEYLYHAYHRPEFLPRDPLAFAHRYPSPTDREVVALMAASFAFGNVKAIASALEVILGELGPQPAAALAETEPRHWTRRFPAFTYRWVREEDLWIYLSWIGRVLRDQGSLGALWQSLDAPADPTVLPTMQRFVEAITAAPVDGVAERERWLKRAGGSVSALPSGARLLLTAPEKKSTCKRMNLFLRWVCRPDDGVDLGLWPVDPARLVMPVDTHVMQVTRALGLADLRAPTLSTALAITDAFAAISPADPCRYDFALTRPGILGLKEEAKALGIRL